MNKLLIVLSFSINLFILNICYAFETKAKYAILTDADTGEVLFEKNADIPMAPSSMSKLMTIYMVFDALNKKSLCLEDKFTVSENAWRKAGSKMFIHINEQVTIENLLRGVVIQSGNDACIAIAEGMSGSEESFAELMNIKAKELGLINSNIKNSTGWPDPEHFMSSRDLSILATKLIKEFPQYYYFFSEKDFTFNNIKQENRNMLLNRNIGVDGLKTGHTDIAGYGITASAAKNNRRLVLVVNGLKGTIERAVEAEKLLQYGFFNFDNISLFKKDEIIDVIDVWLGKEKTVQLFIDQDLTVTLPKNDIKNLKSYIEYHVPIKAPIHKNQTIGKIYIELPNKNILTYDLKAKEKVEAAGIFDRLIRNLYYSIFGKTI